MASTVLVPFNSDVSSPSAGSRASGRPGQPHRGPDPVPAPSDLTRAPWPRSRQPRVMGPRPPARANWPLAYRHRPVRRGRPAPRRAHGVAATACRMRWGMAGQRLRNRPARTGIVHLAAPAGRSRSDALRNATWRGRGPTLGDHPLIGGLGSVARARWRTTSVPFPRLCDFLVCPEVDRLVNRQATDSASSGRQRATALHSISLAEGELETWLSTRPRRREALPVTGCRRLNCYEAAPCGGGEAGRQDPGDGLLTMGASHGALLDGLRPA